MLKRFDLSKMTYFNTEVEGKVQCLIPVPATMKVELEVRSETEVTVNAVTVDGESFPLEIGKIVRWSGLLEGVSAVEIVAESGFWYVCQKSSGWYEFNDGIPLAIELVQTQNDVLRSMVDDRLRAWKVSQEITRELTEEEKDDVILDIINGDLEFEERPDPFGLGYEERLEQYVKRQTAEQSKSAEEEEEVAKPPIAEKRAAEAQVSSDT